MVTLDDVGKLPNWDRESVRGLAVLGVAVAAGAVSVWVLIGPSVCKVWVATVLMVVAITMAATEWTRRVLLSLVALAGLIALLTLTSLGTTQLHIQRVEKTADDLVLLRNDFDRLEALASTANSKARGAQAKSEKDAKTRFRAAYDLSVVWNADPFRTDLAELGKLLVPGFSSDPGPTIEQLNDHVASALPTTPQELRAKQSLAAAVKAAESWVQAKSAAPSLIATDQTSTALRCAEHSADSIVKTGGTAETRRELRKSVADVERQVASLRKDLSGSDDDKATLKALELKRADYVAEDDIAAVDALRAGFKTILLPGPLRQGSVVADAGLFALVAAVAIGWLLWQLRRNEHQLAGPVEIPKDAAARFRVALLQNVWEPGNVPGSESSEPITDLLSINPAAASAKQLLVAVRSLVNPDRRAGYRVEMDSLTVASSPTSPAATETVASTQARTEGCQMLIRVLRRSNGDRIASTVLTAPTVDELDHQAGLWAAGTILHRSTRIPSWAAWSAPTAQAVSVATTPKTDTAALEKGVVAAPHSGVLLYALGQQYELAGRELDAIRTYARAITAHPRYVAPRYRLAGALSMISETALQSVVNMRPDARNQLFRFVGLKLPTPDQGKLTPAACRQSMLTGAIEQYGMLTKREKPWGMAVSALHRSERSSTVNRVKTRKERAASVQVALEICNFRKEGQLSSNLASAESEARLPRCSWNLPYNLACLYAIRGDQVNALNWLELCLTKPGVENLKASWVRRDADLRSLHGHPQFVTFTGSLSESDE